MKLLISTSILLLAFTSGLACTCINTKNISAEEYRKYLEGVSAIFEGEVLSIGDKRTITREYPHGATVEDVRSLVTFRVFRTWKGVDQGEIAVETDVMSSCQFIPMVGSRFIVYARADGTQGRALYINYCSAESFDDAKMKAEYGEGRPVEQPSPTAETTEKTEGFFSFVWNKIISFFS